MHTHIHAHAHTPTCTHPPAPSKHRGKQKTISSKKISNKKMRN